MKKAFDKIAAGLEDAIAYAPGRQHARAGSAAGVGKTIEELNAAALPRRGKR